MFMPTFDIRFYLDAAPPKTLLPAVAVSQRLSKPSIALLIAAAWVSYSCTSVQEEAGEDGPTSAGGDGGYELVIVDDSAASSIGSSQDEMPELRPNGDAELERANLPGVVVFDSEGDFTVQIGIYEGSRAARERVLELSKLGYPAYALGIPGDSRVRVRIGYFSVREDAKRFGQIFKEDSGADYWIDRRDNEAP